MDLYIKNLKYIKKKLGIKNEAEFANLLYLSESNLHSILYGHKKLTTENKILICDILGISLDIFENKDFEEYYKDIPVFDILKKTGDDILNKSYFKILDSLLIDDGTIKNDKYLKYIRCIKNPENLLNIKLDADEWAAEYVIETCFNCYVETKNLNVCLNTLIIILMFWINIHEPFSDLNTTIIDNQKENAIREKASIQTRNEDEFTKCYYFMAMDLLKELNKVEEYKDFIPFYLALKTMYNFVHKPWRKFSNIEARSIGTAMLVELDQIGNKYIKNIML